MHGDFWYCETVSNCGRGFVTPQRLIQPLVATGSWTSCYPF